MEFSIWVILSINNEQIYLSGGEELYLSPSFIKARILYPQLREKGNII